MRPDDLPDAAINAAAEVLLRAYDSEFDAAHLTPANFTDDARAALLAALPHLEAAIRADTEPLIEELTRQITEGVGCLGCGTRFAAPDLDAPCPVCTARRDEAAIRADERAGEQTTTTCPECNGDRFGESEYRCPTCNGTGRVPSSPTTTKDER